ncbi:MAG: S41 family peptidase [Candidatus Krumholzibacteriia bacterium]
MRRLSVACVLVALGLGATAAFALTPPVIPDTANPEDMRLLRQPDIHGDRIVFVYGGDLWLVPAAGGEARRLTSSVGYESLPKFSPDGTQIAFSGEYDGNNDVYVIPATGGEPVRLTFHPAWDRVVDWEPDGKSIRFLSPRRQWGGFSVPLWTVPVSGGLETEMPFSEGGLSSWSPDGKQLAFNRQIVENRTWKRYKGGMAQDIWVHDFTDGRTTRLTDWVGADNFPMWVGDTIYFTSDRTGRLQIWAHDLKSGQERQITQHDEYDVKWPSLGTDSIVYENGGWLWVLDLASEKSRRVTVSLHDDHLLARPSFRDVSDRIESAGLAPDAKRAVFVARGDVFTVPAEKGDVRNLTQTPGIRERGAVWSPDGRWIAYLSDRTGEYELYVRPGDGKGPERQVTHGAAKWRFDPRWSPDSQRLAFSDSDFDLWLVEASDGALTKVDHAPVREIDDLAWSADGRWLAYAKVEPNQFRSIFLYDTKGKGLTRVTSDQTDDANPAFDPAGKYLFFSSARHFQPVFGGYDQRPFFTRQDGLYLVVLKADAPTPFAPESDEAAVKDADKPAGDAQGKAKKAAADKDKAEARPDDKAAAPPAPVEIDLNGLADRVVALPVDAGNYGALRAADGKLFYLDRPALPAGGDEEDGGGGGTLKVFLMDKREAKDVLSGVDGYDLSADGKKLLYAKGDKYGIVDAAADQKPAEKPLRTGEMKAKLDPPAEWAQMLREVWRLERDFFYDPGLHGVDWEAMGRRYGQLIPYAAHRADLEYLIGELIGELNCSHTYTGGGDLPKVPRVGTGLLGCDFRLEPGADRYRIVGILRERDWNADQRTPLAGPGIDVKEGDYLLAVDGVELRAPTSPYSLFENKVDRQVVLKVATDASGKDARDVTVQPIGSELGLRYAKWAGDNRRKVAELSRGRIGYFHMPNTAVGGVQEFAKGYYPQLKRDAIIIDERNNGGGFIPDIFTLVLGQKPLNLWGRRPGMQSEITPPTAFPGPLAMLVNGYAGSGGDALPWYFKEAKLGPVIGKRTWGGLVGIDRGIALVDGGSITMPAFGFYTLDGQWGVENHGTEPDIDIDNLPDDEFKGHDAQLEKAVEVLMQALDRGGAKLPERPPYPRDKAQ